MAELKEKSTREGKEKGEMEMKYKAEKTKSEKATKENKTLKEKVLNLISNSYEHLRIIIEQNRAVFEEKDQYEAGPQSF